MASPNARDVSAASSDGDPNRRLISRAALLLSTILVLLCPSLLANAAHRTPRAQGDESSRAANSSAAPTQRAGFDVAPFWNSAPKGKQHASPGQRPGNRDSKKGNAL